MEHQKILNLSNEANDSYFVTRKWNIVNDNSKANYGVGREIIYNTKVLKLSLSDYNDAYTLVGGNIIVRAAPAIQVAFKNCAPFTKCFAEIGGKTIDDVEELDLVIPLYNLLEYGSNYSKTTRSLWF